MNHDKPSLCAFAHMAAADFRADSSLAPRAQATARLLASAPSLGEPPILRDGRNWRRFEASEWPQAWKDAALELGMFEESDFRSTLSEAHRQRVESGAASGPYQGSSRFKNWWASKRFFGDPAGDAFERQAHAARAGEREAFEAWVVTDASDQEPLGLMVFERWADRVRRAPIQHLGERKPKNEFNARIFGEAAFWVAPAARGQGLGSQLAQALVGELLPRMQSARKIAPLIPFVVAHDRGHKLLSRLDAFPLTTRRAFGSGQAHDLARAGIEQEEWWPQWKTPVESIAPAPRAPKKRSGPR